MSQPTLKSFFKKPAPKKQGAAASAPPAAEAEEAAAAAPAAPADVCEISTEEESVASPAAQPESGQPAAEGAAAGAAAAGEPAAAAPPKKKYLPAPGTAIYHAWTKKLWWPAYVCDTAEVPSNLLEGRLDAEGNLLRDDEVVLYYYGAPRSTRPCSQPAP
eukprot:COSAG04_NODE_22_length_37957_cov_250.276930_12_plen_160_part_00